MMPDLAVAWDVLFDTLLGDRTVLAGRVREAIQAQLSSYRTMPRETLDEEIGFQVERVLRSAHGGCAAVSDSELVELTAIGETRAQQGVPVDDMLRAWRIGVEVAIGFAREAGQQRGIEDAQVLEFVQATLAWSDVAMVTTARAHRKAELALALAEEKRGAAFVRGTLFGTVSAAELRIQAEGTVSTQPVSSLRSVPGSVRASRGGNWSVRLVFKIRCSARVACAPSSTATSPVF